MAKPRKPNTSAPVPGENADVQAAGAGQPVPPAITESAIPETPVQKQDTPPAGDSATTPTHIQVRARPEAGFRRAGRYWPPVETCLPLADFDEPQLAALRAEPELEVVFSVEEAGE